MIKKVILYGAGKDGVSALNFLGKENVLCFCDNKKNRDGSIKGVPVKSFDELMRDYQGECIIITASTSKSIFDITRQLERAGVEYTLFDYYVEEQIRAEGEVYNKLNAGRSSFEYKQVNEYLVSRDRGEEAGEFGSYFWQDLWAAKHIYERKPRVHFDIGSRIDGFISHLLSFGQKVKQIDIRPLESSISGWEFVQSDATLLEEIPDGSIDSLSALCSLEHFGLGRYGDEIDPEACFKCFKAIQNKMAGGGMVYISVPISGEEHLEFNAHRVFHPLTIVNEFDELDLKEFSATEGKRFYEGIDIRYFDEYRRKGGGLFGLFCFQKVVGYEK